MKLKNPQNPSEFYDINVLLRRWVRLYKKFATLKISTVINNLKRQKKSVFSNEFKRTFSNFSIVQCYGFRNAGT